MSHSHSPFEARLENDSSPDAASALLSTAIRGTEVPVMRMANALTRISTLLSRLEAQAASAPCGAEDYRRLIEQDLSICIQSLQFHDRLIQQLTTVRTLIGAQPANGESCNGLVSHEGSVELF